MLLVPFNRAHGTTPNDTLRKRLPWVLAGESALVGVSSLGMYQLWYKPYSTGRFHFFNDNAEWEGMDKFGHAWSAYHISGSGYRLMRFSGMRHKAATWAGAAHGFGFLLIMEMMDGVSAGWGFSPGDLLANTAGAGFFIGQRLLWIEPKIHYKFGFSGSDYAPYRPNLLGESLGERIVKDYNGQTYWLTCAPGVFVNNSPLWLKIASIAVGYSANGMVSGRRTDVPIGLEHIDRYRQLYLSLDVDWSQIPVKNKHLKSALKVLNSFKIPLPGMEINKFGLQFRMLAW
jgi:uncharacterized protein YfiM (DUF2279 family)